MVTPQIQPTIVAANQGISQIAPYVPGKPVTELKREFGWGDDVTIVKLASNENPLGCSPKALHAITDALAEVGRYPDGNGFTLKDALCKQFAVDMTQITLGNGSNDILELVARTFIGAGDNAIYSQHGFAVYPLAIQAVGAQGIEVPAKDFGHDLPAMAKAVQANTKVIFIANPNNPTGTWFNEDTFSHFMQHVPAHVLVVLDEAYVEYFPDNFNSLPFLKKHPNLLISRTFSKAYGLASLRVGFGLASSEVTNLLNRVRQPFNVNSLALAAATESVQDFDFVTQTRKLNHAGMAQLEVGFKHLGLTWIPSRCNFICVNVAQANNQPTHKSGIDVFNALLKLGVIVRPVANYSLPDFIRVTIGLPSENQRFLEALTQILSKSMDGH